MQAAIVTGGASGLGEATVRYLVSRGHYTYILDTNNDLGNRLAAELGGNTKCAYIQCDVTSEADAVAAIAKMDKPIHVLVNSAGVGHGERVIGHKLSSFQRVININLIGSFNLIRLVAAKMASQDPIDADGQRGVLINVASIAAYEGQPGQAAYSASKGALVGMTVPIARELSKFGIRCVTIAPGIMNTAMLANLPDKIKKALGRDNVFPKRFGHMEEFARLVGSIMDNTFLNGTTLRLDGSVHMSNL